MIDSLISGLHYALSFFVILSVIVFIHEFGHYIIAKLCGVRVLAFSIGFGKEMFGWTDRSGTRWKVALLPLGGYVKMFGDAGAASTPDAHVEELSDDEKNLTFHHKPLHKKAAIVAAGPIANFLLTIGILTYFIMSVGLSSTEPVVGDVMKDTPASAAGLRTGDRIISVNDSPMERFNDIPSAIATNMGTPVTLLVERGEEQITLSITPAMVESDDGLGNTIKRPLIGIKSQQLTYEDVGLPRAMWEATKRTYDMCTSTFHVLGQMISGQRSAEDLKGPVGIAKLSGQAADQGFFTVLWLMALLSANLGLVNLFPIPLLDGGHLLYYAVEAVRGRPMAIRVQEFGFRIGFVLLASLMGFTIFNDLRQLF